MTSEELMLCLFNRPGISVWESGNNVSLITISIALLSLSFFIFELILAICRKIVSNTWVRY